MDDSNLLALQNRADEAVDDILEYDNAYVYARAAYQSQMRHVLKYDKKGLQVPPEENEKLADLKRDVREKHERTCSEHKKAVTLFRQILDAINANPDKHKDEIEKYENYVDNYSECKDASDWQVLEELSGEESSLLDISSDIADNTEDEQEAEVVDKNMPRVQMILDELKSMKDLQSDLDSLMKVKNENKAVMFTLRDRGKDVSSYQQQQRGMYQNLIDGRAKLQELRSKIRNDIYDVIPKLEVYEVAQKLQDIAYNIEEEELMEQDISISAESTVVPEIARIPPPKNISRIPKVGAKKLSSIPQRSLLKPPSGTRPQTAPTPAKRTQFLEVPGPQPRPRPSGIPTRRPMPVNPKVQEEIDRHRSKQAVAQSIKKFGTYQNLQQTQHLQQIPKVIPQQIVDKRKRQHGALLRVSESIGNVRKVGIKPMREMCK
jgi:hypothetical protein